MLSQNPMSMCSGCWRKEWGLKNAAFEETEAEMIKQALNHPPNPYLDGIGL